MFSQIEKFLNCFKPSETSEKFKCCTSFNYDFRNKKIKIKCLADNGNIIKQIFYVNTTMKDCFENYEMVYISINTHAIYFEFLEKIHNV